LRNPQNDNAGTLTRSASDEGAAGDPKSPVRTCVLTRTPGTRDSLIRLALGPDGQVAPDVRARAPGRGAWIGVNRTALDAANAKGKLKGALNRAFKTGDLDVPADLGERIETALRQSALDRLGLEARGGTLLSGADKVETACRAGRVKLLIHAEDAGLDGRKRLDAAWRVGGGPSTSLGTGAQGLVFPATRPILSMALGRENVVHIALTDHAAATRVLHAITRWRAFIDLPAGLDGRDAVAGLGSADEHDEGNT
jgi:predicted RNA-binding protein YlxR (DUF448 family)